MIEFLHPERKCFRDQFCLVKPSMPHSFFMERNRKENICAPTKELFMKLYGKSITDPFRIDPPVMKLQVVDDFFCVFVLQKKRMAVVKIAYVILTKIAVSFFFQLQRFGADDAGGLAVIDQFSGTDRTDQDLFVVLFVIRMNVREIFVAVPFRRKFQDFSADRTDSRKESLKCNFLQGLQDLIKIHFLFSGV